MINYFRQRRCGNCGQLGHMSACLLLFFSPPFSLPPLLLSFLTQINPKSRYCRNEPQMPQMGRIQLRRQRRLSLRWRDLSHQRDEPPTQHARRRWRWWRPLQSRSRLALPTTPAQTIPRFATCHERVRAGGAVATGYESAGVWT